MAEVLFIDDDEASESATIKGLLGENGVNCRFLHPEEVTLPDLLKAHVVVVDYFLTHWRERDDSDSISRAPENGLAVISNLRSKLLPGVDSRELPGDLPNAVAFALWSGNLPEATFNLPEYVLPGVFARENNLEWVFRRNEVIRPEGSYRLARLADAVEALRTESIARFEPVDWLASRLALGESPWRAEALEDVLRCRPPLFDLASRTGGMAIVRWLLHRIMPYPCFLIDDRELAARLCVDNLDDAGALFEGLRDTQYAGLLSEFLGRRWWRAGIEDWLYRVTQGESSSPSAVAALAHSLGARSSRQWLRPVVTLDSNFAANPLPSEADDVLRIRPDDWPPYADDAFARIEDARNIEDLRRIVDPADTYLLKGAVDATAF